MLKCTFNEYEFWPDSSHHSIKHNKKSCTNFRHV